MHKIALILDNIRSTHNVGNILRTADGFGVNYVFLCGYTPYPSIPNDPRLPHEHAKITRAIHKTALGAETTVPFGVYNNVNDAIMIARQQGYTIAALEQSPSSISLPIHNNNQDIAIVLGNEINGVANDTLNICDLTLEIPMFGSKESFNVSISAAICLYELVRQQSS